jgi:hypothetical protein
VGLGGVHFGGGRAGGPNTRRMLNTKSRAYFASVPPLVAALASISSRRATLPPWPSRTYACHRQRMHSVPSALPTYCLTVWERRSLVRLMSNELCLRTGWPRAPLPPRPGRHRSCPELPCSYGTKNVPGRMEGYWRTDKSLNELPCAGSTSEVPRGFLPRVRPDRQPGSRVSRAAALAGSNSPRRTL